MQWQCPHKRQKGTQTQRRSLVKMEAETGMMGPRTKGHLEPQELEEGKRMVPISSVRFA
jgi:hypothetical protein